MDPPHLLLLISKSSMGNRDFGNQDLAATMLQSHGLTFQVLDGADPTNRERRNELFGISGLRAKYPQLFCVKSKEDPPTFLGDFDTIQELNECGLLTASNLGIISTETTTSTDAAPVENTIRGLPTDTDASDDTTIPAGGTQGVAQLLLLISNLSGNRQQDANQNQIRQLLQQSKSISSMPIQFLDGADPHFRQRRDELFGISGLRAKYPQLFVVMQSPKVSFLPFLGTKSTTIFVGDYETIQEMEKDGSLTEANLLERMARQQNFGWPLSFGTVVAEEAGESESRDDCECTVCVIS